MSGLSVLTGAWWSKTMAQYYSLNIAVMNTVQLQYQNSSSGVYDVLNG